MIDLDKEAVSGRLKIGSNARYYPTQRKEDKVEQNKQSVRIDFVTGYSFPPVIGFDFGDFAILLTYDCLRVSGGFQTFYGNDYQQFPSRLRYELRYFSKYHAEFVFRLSRKTVEKIRATFKNHASTPYNELFSLLESCTPRDILPKFFVT